MQKMRTVFNAYADGGDGGGNDVTMSIVMENATSNGRKNKHKAVTDADVAASASAADENSASHVSSHIARKITESEDEMDDDLAVAAAANARERANTVTPPMNIPSSPVTSAASGKKATAQKGPGGEPGSLAAHKSKEDAAALEEVSIVMFFYVCLCACS
jgi:hypothetical protein